MLFRSGQDKAAKVSIDHATQSTSDTWIILQNCHLATSYLSSIEKLLEEIPPEPKLPFRVWFTTMPSNEFPISLLQKCVKVTSERPKGVAKNMLNALNAIDSEIFEETGKSAEIKKKIILSICLFHSIIIERGKFGTMAWNTPYEFSQADLLISVEQISLLLKESADVPWESLNYLIADSNYGGRINDEMDARVFQAVLSDFLTPSILNDGYTFCNKKEYAIPKSIRSLENCLKLAKNLPQKDDPEIFGLSEAASLSYLSNDALTIRSMLLTLVPHAARDLVEVKENEVTAKAQAILQEIPEKLDIEECLKKFPISYTETINTCLQQEVIKYNRLLLLISSQLKNFERAQHGELLMTNELEEVGHSICNNVIPSLWQNNTYSNTKSLSSWINDLKIHTKFISDWILNGYPKSYQISAFFNPKDFLSAIKQNYARKIKLPFDDIIFENIVIENNDEIKENGILLSGMYLEGATWKGKLAEYERTGTIEKFPNILFTPIEINKKAKLENVILKLI